jgi:hypothetical protein
MYIQVQSQKDGYLISTPKPVYLGAFSDHFPSFQRVTQPVTAWLARHYTMRKVRARAALVADRAQGGAT